MTARRRNTERSIRMDIVSMSRNRIGHIPHPPSWKPSANILRTVISGPPYGASGVWGGVAIRPSAGIRAHTVALVVPDRFAPVSSRFHNCHRGHPRSISPRLWFLSPVLDGRAATRYKNFSAHGRYENSG